MILPVEGATVPASGSCQISDISDMTVKGLNCFLISKYKNTKYYFIVWSQVKRYTTVDRLVHMCAETETRLGMHKFGVF